MAGQLSTGHPGATGYQHRALGKLSARVEGMVNTTLPMWRAWLMNR